MSSGSARSGAGGRIVQATRSPTLTTCDGFFSSFPFHGHLAVFNGRLKPGAAGRVVRDFLGEKCVQPELGRVGGRRRPRRQRRGRVSTPVLTVLTVLMMATVATVLTVATRARRQVSWVVERTRPMGSSEARPSYRPSLGGSPSAIGRVAPTAWCMQ